MNIVEMILKASKDGKTYICKKDDVTYSKVKGFIAPPHEDNDCFWKDGWVEKPKRHLTIEEAEKELDCVIDTDFRKLLRLPDKPPKDDRTVFAILRDSDWFNCCYLLGEWHVWSPYLVGWQPTEKPLYWIDPVDIRKLLSE